MEARRSPAAPTSFFPPGIGKPRLPGSRRVHQSRLRTLMRKPPMITILRRILKLILSWIQDWL